MAQRKNTYKSVSEYLDAQDLDLGAKLDSRVVVVDRATGSVTLVSPRKLADRLADDGKLYLPAPAEWAAPYAARAGVRAGETFGAYVRRRFASFVD